MAKSGITNVSANNTFQTWLDKTNEVVDIIKTETITASVSGDTTGSLASPLIANLIGTFTANNVNASTLLRADNISPLVGSTEVNINAPAILNTTARLSFDIDSTARPIIRLSDPLLSWDVGFVDDASGDFCISTGVGSARLKLSTVGNLVVAGTLASDGFSINASTATIDGDLNVGGELDITGRSFFAAGTAAAPSLSNRADTDTGVYLGAASGGFSVGGTSRLHIDSNGRVGIGTTTPSYNLEVVSVTDTALGVRSTGTASSDDAFIYLTIGGTTAQSRILLGDSGSVSVGEINYNHSNNSMSFITNGSSRLSINSTGEILIGATSVADQSRNFKSVNSLAVGTATSPGAGEIRATGDITAFYSDLRLKDLNGPIENSLEKVLSLTGYRYTANQTAVDLGYSTETQVGLVAQEVQAILPEVVTIAPISYEIDENYLTIKYERLIPLLVEAIKDLKKEIDELKSNR